MNDYKDLMNNEKHYVTFNNYLRYKYHEKVARISLNAGFTCPNRDGNKGVGGCIYCSNNLSGDFAGDKNKTFEEQFSSIEKVIQKKWDADSFIAYLQAGSNTYADINTLKNVYNSLLKLNENIKVISIATRPDCINEEIVQLLSCINKQKEVWIELGLQSIHATTQKYLNLCYTTADFEKACNMLIAAKIKVIVHLINGLPSETEEMMIENAKYLAKFSLFGVKIHMLHIMKNTNLGEIYQKKPFALLTLADFVRITATMLRYLPTSIVIHRLTGDAPKDELIEPIWTLKKFVVLNEIDKYMRKNNIYQGDLCIK